MYKVMLLIGVVMVLAACSSTPATTGTTQTTVDAQEFKFQPATIQVKAGQPVKLTLRNQGSVEHDFSIMKIELAKKGAAAATPSGHNMSGMEEPELHVAAAAKQSASVEFTPSQTGTYEFWCTVAGHKEAGMTGTLVVQ